MSDDNKKCWSCASFKAYYTRAYGCFLREDKGFCHKHNKIMKKKDGCDKWAYRKTNKNEHKKMAVDAMVDIHKKLAIVERIFNDDSELLKLKDETDK